MRDCHGSLFLFESCKGKCMNTLVASVRAVRSRAIPGSYLFGPFWDFFLLGGGSLLGLLLIKLLFGHVDKAQMLLVTIFLANFINHPHFAHSYQMFYRGFGHKITQYPSDLRIRYIISGIVVPIALIFFFGLTIYFESMRVLGLAANLMFFLVGWHYVKQGYGMAMVDAVLKRRFYLDAEKKALLQNAYVVWALAYFGANYLINANNHQYYGIEYFAIPVPGFLLFLITLLCLFTTVRLFIALKSRVAEKKKLAWNGLLAYGVSLYAWLLIRDPLVLLWIPLFHSLQYLAVVWRYELNRNKTKVSTIRPAVRFALFSAIGFGLGYLGFWFVPEWLNANTNYAKDIFGDYLFLYVFWIFINVHHYTLDAVMWRKGNPDVQAHLFTH